MSINRAIGATNRITFFRASAVFISAMISTANAQDISSPSAADYVAAKNRVAMARVEAELSKIQQDAKGVGHSQLQGNNPGQFVPRAMTSEPTVERVKAKRDGTLVAMIAMGNGTVIPAWAGKSLGRGMVVKSVTTSDVIVTDGAGIHPLAWSDGSTFPANTGAMPFGVPMSGTLPIPVTGN